jgi:hypothetical protein
MSLNKVDILKLFKTNLIKFLDALIEQMPSEGDLIFLRIMFDSQIPMEEAISIFCERIMPYQEMVKTKDDRFFLEGTDLFSGLQKEKVSYFKDLWLSPQFTSEDKDEIWKWFRLFLNIAIKWQSVQ